MTFFLGLFLVLFPSLSEPLNTLKAFNPPDTLYSEVLVLPTITESFLNSNSLISPEQALIAKRSAVYIDCRDSIPDGFPQSLLGYQILQIDTCVVYAYSPRDIVLDTMLVNSSIDGFAAGNRVTSYTLSSVSDGSIRRSYEIRGNTRHFYTVVAKPSSSDFPELFNSIVTLPKIDHEELISASHTAFLFENIQVNKERWDSLDLPGGNSIWGSRSDSSLIREVVLGRRVGTALRIPSNWQEGFAIKEESPLSLGFDHCFPFELITQLRTDFALIEAITNDTLNFYREAYTYVKPDSTFADPNSQQGFIFMIPIAGPLLDSIAIGRLPSLSEFAWSAADATAMYIGWQLGKWYFSKTAVRYADDAFETIVRYGTPDELLTTRTRTQELRNALLSLNRMTDDGAAHHIVALTDGRANVSRQILARAGIGVDDVVNGVGLPKTFHSHLHTNLYFAEVERRLLNVSNGTGYQIGEVLRSIQQELLAGTFPH